MTPVPFPDRSTHLPQLAGPTVGLFTFAAMLLLGLWRGNPVEIILIRSLAGLVAATTLGCIAGALTDRVLRDSPLAALPDSAHVNSAEFHNEETSQ